MHSALAIFPPLKKPVIEKLSESACGFPVQCGQSVD
jgi:hypothetical protein